MRSDATIMWIGSLVSESNDKRVIHLAVYSGTRQSVCAIAVAMHCCTWFPCINIMSMLEENHKNPVVAQWNGRPSEHLSGRGAEPIPVAQLNSLKQEENVQFGKVKTSVTPYSFVRGFKYRGPRQRSSGTTLRFCSCNGRDWISLSCADLVGWSLSEIQFRSVKAEMQNEHFLEKS
jgi:hypothetical protein